MIAVVEDDKSINELICYALTAVGFECVSFFTGAQLYKDIAEGKVYDLILLDVMLPDQDGLTILKKLRNSADTASVPIIIITALGTELDKVKGLDLGADDYITKPFGIMELTSRVKARLRRNAQSVDVLKFGEIHLDDASHTVLVEGKTVSLTLKEYLLLKVLMENSGRVLTREMLLDKVWGYNFEVETRTVDVHVRSLRTKLGAYADEIVTVRGVGYRFGGQ